MVRFFARRMVVVSGGGSWLNEREEPMRLRGASRRERGKEAASVLSHLRHLSSSL